MNFDLILRAKLMAKLTTGILIGLVLGMYLASAAAGGSSQFFSYVEIFFKNIFGA
jgi:hypothetical protein